MISVLIVGVLPYDSGKTTFAVRLIKEAIEEGFDVGVSKPFGGFNGWYQHEYVIKSREIKMLVGEDAYKLHTSAKSIDPIEIESPITTLLMPPDPERLGWRVSYYTSVGSSTQIVLARITSPRSTTHYYVPENVNKLTPPLREEVKKLITTLSAEPISMTELGDLLIKSRSLADECLRYIKRLHDFVVIESYGNYAAPTFGSLNSDLVIAVAPSKAVIFRGKDYKNAISVYSNIKSPWMITTEDILPALRPIKKIEFGPEGPKDILNYVVEASSSL
ncbi:hypothetical protein PNA2_1372 [Pyrococcus sp. NA2]|uniref:ATPase n=1 Tax=Pyrococcus sp. (strain NA2) TaxID=342949 RepID=UPI000209AE90|nr:ATPase [Pyrococcus sp. NA2]AEC52286.1 hypothetical protein PNA2_1372 [Pyrococcus sp. NA2]